VLSELEGVVLGVIHRRRECTAYGVRRELIRSPSTHWSASAGSIYPLLKRLESAGLVRSRVASGRGRGRRLLELTADGLSALRAWTMRGPEPDVVRSVSDPVRTRVFFLGALTPAERTRFVADALSALEDHLERTRADLQERDAGPGSFDRLAALGAVYEAEARVAWMKELLERLPGRPASGRS